MDYTKEQLEAINNEGTNIIVSAGAGSGKTAVLTKRVIRKLQNGVDIDRILVLTFTNEAANEMKDRIRKAIIKENMKRQLSLLDSAYITTFDSYALSIVKKYHYLLNINANVKIIDSNIIKIYKYKIIDEIFEKKYGENNEKFNKLINDFCLKDDKSLKENVLNISEKLELLVDKDEYLKNYKKYYETNFIDKMIAKYFEIIKKEIKNLKNTYTNFSYYITDNLNNKLLDYFEPLFEGETYEDFVLFKTKTSVKFIGVDEEGKKIKDEIKKIIENITKLIRFENIEEIKDSILKTEDYADEIIDIIKKLNSEVNKYKEEYDTYEFNDIAHFAINIVKDNKDIQDEMKEYFNEIMIDEYQDTSPIQEAFISMISNNNVYMVGDIKQSIYRFRNANPYIFYNKYNSYSKNEGGLKIDLLKNFRSRKETLFNINEIFNLIMDEEIGNAEYQESHNMIYGNYSYDNEDNKANNYLEIYNYKKDDDEFEDYEKELFIVAEDIEDKIKNKYQVYDKDKEGTKLRDITYKDICIITDRNKLLDEYKKILEYKSIPTVLYKNEELTSDSDILVIKNLIELVLYVKENKYDSKFKYLYTSVARSFLFEYTDNEIYQIHTNKEYRKDKIVELCKEINIYAPLCELINEIIEKFNIYEKLTILNNINNSIIRIENLLSIANNLTELNYSIEDFINYFNEIIEKGLKIEYNLSTKGNNSVKIMNIHKSKGLEFSLCYFVGMQNTFATKEIKEKFLYNEECGLISQYKKEEELKDTILKDIYVDNYFIEEISEKIRLFYVALTRCREKMIIVTSLDENRVGENTLVDASKRIKYKSFLDILNSVDVINKYVVDKKAEYTHEYKNLKHEKLLKSNCDIKYQKRTNEIKYIDKETKHFSKEVKKLLDKETINKMEYGTKIHEILEYSDFNNPNNKYINNLLEKIDRNFINVYKEFEFIYEENSTKYHGIIDLLLEYKDHYKIIDYKLKNIEDENYYKQLNGYKKYIEDNTNKKAEIYLYSILENELNKL